MITYREAHLEEAKIIAQLHTESWRQHYRGILHDTYLDGKIHADRLQVWQQRFQYPKETQHIIVAIDAEEVCGFACIYTKDDTQYGALLDNLHVLPNWQGQGIGQKLMQLTAQWVHQYDATSGLYLWVYEENAPARTFYEQMGGSVAEKSIVENPGGGSASVLRIVWSDPSMIMSTK